MIDKKTGLEIIGYVLRKSHEEWDMYQDYLLEQEDAERKERNQEANGF